MNPRNGGLIFKKGTSLTSYRPNASVILSLLKIKNNNKENFRSNIILLFKALLSTLFVL